MSALARTQDWCQPSSLQEARELCELLAQSGFVPTGFRNRPADIFAAMAFGAELGLSPMASLVNVHVVEGRPTLSSDAMLGRVKTSGLCASWVIREWTHERCTIETQRVGAPEPQTLTWTFQDAQRADIAGPTRKGKKSVWQKYTRAMLRARCTTDLCRAVYPDVVGGWYDADELAPRVSEAMVDDQADAVEGPRATAILVDEAARVVALPRPAETIVEAQVVEDEPAPKPTGPSMEPHARDEARRKLATLQERFPHLEQSDLRTRLWEHSCDRHGLRLRKYGGPPTITIEDVQQGFVDALAELEALDAGTDIDNAAELREVTNALAGHLDTTVPAVISIAVDAIKWVVGEKYSEHTDISAEQWEAIRVRAFEDGEARRAALQESVLGGATHTDQETTEA